MKIADIEAKKPALIGISVKLTPREHEALKDVVWALGHTSFQSFFRSLAVQKLREAAAPHDDGGSGHAA
jgi:hypothetical protein